MILQYFQESNVLHCYTFLQKVQVFPHLINYQGVAFFLCILMPNQEVMILDLLSDKCNWKNKVLTKQSKLVCMIK